jgi:hypothetical protein
MEGQKLDTSNDFATLSIRRNVQLFDFSKRAMCRVARIHGGRDAIFKLRYQCFLRAGLISQNSFGRYIETDDHAANAYLMGLYVERRLVSSLRLQIGSPISPKFSSLELFPYVLEPLLRSNKTVVDLSCVATDAELARPYGLLPYLILRSWIIAAEHFHADYIVAAVRPQHQLFYQRVLNCELHSKRVLPSHQLAPVGLVTLNFATSARRLCEKLPFLRSTSSERQQIFDGDRTSSNGAALHSSIS